MPLSAQQIERLQRKTMVTAIETFAELPSTNDLALERAADRNVTKPLLIIARRQTQGRGRGNNQWWSTDGALTFSLLTDAPLAAADQRTPLISLAVGVAVADALAVTCPGLGVGLKWPNDVYVKERKIGGILIERPARVEGLVIGIGLNVNQSFADAPPPIATQATSLQDETGRSHEMGDLLLALLQCLQRRCGQLASDPGPIRHRWAQYCTLEGREVTVTAGSVQHRGRCRGIDGEGRLILEAGGQQLVCPTGVVQWRSPRKN